MRTLACLTLPAVLAGLIFAPPAAGQAKPRVQITDVRLGFPAGPFSRDLDEDGRARPLFKAAFFAPVYVDVQCNEAVEEPLRLVVSTADGTDVMHTYTVPLPPLSPGQTLSAVELPYLPYTKPGSFIAELEVSLHAGERRLGQPFTRTFFGLDPSEYLILTAGSRLPAFRLPPRPGAPEADAADLGAVRLAAVEHARQLPDRWFGYEGVDLMILTTGGDEGRLVQDLFTLPENRSRKAALLEWVRRGGRLLVSVGRSADVVVPLDEFQQILPATIPPGGRRFADVIELRWVGVGDLARKQLRLRPGDGGQVPYAALQPRPDRAARALPQQSEPSPLIVQAPYGLGRVTLAGFDLDQPPFTEAESPGEFWQWLVNRSASRLPERAADGTLPRDNRFRPGAVESDLYLNTLQANLEYFEGVPVVSFGWVALFIVLYILIIGPLDYLFLKKVVKRLEWTWV
ncbi:MAG TPA: hypothetical protein VIL46_15830, partial [Gemmataceae bacterium]